MQKLTSQKNIQAIVKRHGFCFTKSLGQNFLIDENILRKIVEGADICSEDIVLEIGPGAGTLTRALSEQAAQVIAVEIDGSLIPILQETLQGRENIHLIQEDILKVDLRKLIKEHAKGKEIKVVANLPYYITTPIIMRFLEEEIPMESMTVMIQREVAERLHAGPNSKDYGSLSVAVQYYCDTSMVTKVPKTAFIPPPLVDSAVICLKVKKQKSIELENEKLFFEVVRAGFSKRRKTLLNALSSYGSLKGKEETEKILRRAGIDPSRRAETLTIEEFAELANVYESTINPRSSR